MYIDNLTITALVIFAFEFVLFVRFCMFGQCGGPLREDETAVQDGLC
ncbi:MAG: hypothetical protein R3F42_08465 [Pseudomonadota bacterium]